MIKKITALKVAGWALLIVIIVGVFVITALYVRTNDQLGTQQQEAQQQLTEVRDQLEGQLDDILSDLEAEESSGDTVQAKVAELDSQRDNGNEFGIAVISFSSVEDVFNLEIIGQLGDARPQGSYTVELRNDSDVKSVGVLVKEVENTYVLSYESSENLLEYEQVTIYEETGGTKEIVLEGSLESE